MAEPSLYSTTHRQDGLWEISGAVDGTPKTVVVAFDDGDPSLEDALNALTGKSLPAKEISKRQAALAVPPPAPESPAQDQDDQVVTAAQPSPVVPAEPGDVRPQPPTFPPVDEAGQPDSGTAAPQK